MTALELAVSRRTCAIGEAKVLVIVDDGDDSNRRWCAPLIGDGLREMSGGKGLEFVLVLAVPVIVVVVGGGSESTLEEVEDGEVNESAESWRVGVRARGVTTPQSASPSCSVDSLASGVEPTARAAAEMTGNGSGVVVRVGCCIVATPVLTPATVAVVCACACGCA